MRRIIAIMIALLVICGTAWAFGPFGIQVQTPSTEKGFLTLEGSGVLLLEGSGKLKLEN